MKALLSIRPKYIEKIVKRDKKYEFRKSIFRRDVNEVWIYATFPIKKIIGTFRIGEIIKDTPRNLWKNLCDFSGMDEQEFFSYFNGTKTGFALEIKHIKLFKQPIDPKVIFSNFIPPQSFYYLKDELDELTRNAEVEIITTR